MQDYSPIAGFSLTLAGQRVPMHKCGSLGTYVNASDIQTLSNKNFLFYDSGPDPERIVMFATRENLDFLAMSSI